MTSWMNAKSLARPGAAGMARAWPWLGMVLVFLALMLRSPLGLAQTDSGFDHSTTIFPLSGLHEQVRCESCHIKGIFKGTPRDCSGCHVQGNQRGAKAKPVNHIQSNNRCEECHTVAAFSVARFNHSTVVPGTCTTCHDGRRTSGLSPNHIPTNVSCDQCHGTSAFKPVLHFDHSVLGSVTNTCATCHDGTQAKGMPTNHLPRSAANLCGACHVASTQTGFMSFAGGQMDHTGLSSGCADCHGPGVAAGAFAGISSIIVMPSTSPASPTAHIPSSTTCESCHLASMPLGLVSANAVAAVPGSGFATPVPTGVQIHAGVTGGCSSCHETNFTWLGMSNYPITPTTFIAKAQYRGFQVRPTAAGGQFAVADAAHPSTGECADCHAGTTYFSGDVKPTNHIPTSASASCNVCHTSSDYAVLPTVTNTHKYAPSTTGNCLQCHGNAALNGGQPASYYAIPEINFSIKALPDNHVPYTAGQECQVCHTSIATPVADGATFANSKMVHAATNSSCETCHGSTVTASSFAGVSKIVVLPATSPAGANSHMPLGTVTDCAKCHALSAPATAMAGVATTTTAGSTGFYPGAVTGKPTSAQVHAGITASNCNQCHADGMTWMSVTGPYPMTPSVLTAGVTSYKGYQTLPKTAGSATNINDALHPAASAGDCSVCHSSTDAFTLTNLTPPTNHMPYAVAAACVACHKVADWATMPSLTDIHANTTTASKCADCHAKAVASTFASSAAFVADGATHLPFSGDCAACHVGTGSSIAALPVKNGAKFSGSAIAHAATTSSCATCHGSTVTGTTFQGVSKIIVLPPTSPAGANSHIPTTAACEQCHATSSLAAQVPGVATKVVPGTAFATPVPNTTQIHVGISGGCVQCHDTAQIWMGVDKYPISPATKSAVSGTKYTGFHNRPGAAGGTHTIADPNHPVGECADCHGSFDAWSSVDTPANHIPFAATAQCSACHTSTNFATIPTTANIHKNAQSTTGNCLQCHGSAALNGGQPASYYAIPAAGFSIKALPDNHVPYTAGQECQVCHTSIATPVADGATFANAKMVHTATNSSCATCHGSAVTATTFAGVTSIVKLPPTSPAGASSHMPLGSVTACDACHALSAPATAMAGVATTTTPGSTGFYPGAVTGKPTSTQVHAGITASNCNQCHADGMTWMSVTVPYPMTPSVLTAGTTSYKGYQTLPKTVGSATNINDTLHPAASAGDCSVCHTSTDTFGLVAPPKHMPYLSSAACTVCHTAADWATMPALTPIHANLVAGATCASCHAKAVASSFTSSAAFVADGATHLPFSGDCAACHVGTGSSIAALPVLNGAKFSGSAMNHAASTSSCATCHGSTVTGTTFQGVSSIVVLPSTSPMGASSHIPTTAACDACHKLTAVPALVPGVATKVAGTGTTLFGTSAAVLPSSAMIHAGMSSGCVTCHEANYQWMGMAAYPVNTTTLNPSQTFQYTGFQTRPTAAGGSNSVRDAGHAAGSTATGDCQACHGEALGFQYFSAAIPANHIPYAASAACSACHTAADFATIPTTTNIHKNAQSTTGNCLQCHGSAALNGGKPASYYAIPAAGFSIKALPDNHVPYTAGQECQVCHTSIATPVADGATFANSKMVHTATNSSCATCHGSAVTATTFAGVTSIVKLPPTSPAGASSHMPLGSVTACDACHALSAPTTAMAGVATTTTAGSTGFYPGAVTGKPTSAQVHAGITASNCNQCHADGMTWMSVTAPYPMTPSVLTAGVTTYKGYQTLPKTAGSATNINDTLHPAASAGDCSVCHTSTDAFGLVAPPKHMPYLSSAACTVCHTAADWATMPALTPIHANLVAGATCASCHAKAVASSFTSSAAFVADGASHLPFSGDCAACHVGTGSSIAALPVLNGAKFSGSAMNHAASTSSCATCHGSTVTGTTFQGVSSIVVLPSTSPMGASSHIPTTAACDACHKLTAVPALVPGVATKVAGTGATLFGTSAAVLPSSAMIHAGMSSGCVTCHEANYQWMGMAAYPVNTTTVNTTTNFQYRGFQTRPTVAGGSNSVRDPAHIGLAATNDCQTCHAEALGFVYFSGSAVPTNHIPYATAAACSACHTAADFATIPTTTNIHKNAQSTTGNCLQCHGNATLNGGQPASYYAIPAAGFSIKALPDNHVPYTAGQECQVCHTSIATPVADGATFANSKMVHTATNSSCATCHGSTVTASTFAGVSKIVVLPATSPAGAGSHMPLGTVTACDACHALSAPATAMAGVATTTTAGSTGFYPGAVTGKPTSAQVHAGITASNCNQCHADGMTWMSVTGPYPMTPSVLTAGVTSYKGYQTLPKTVGSATNINDSFHPAASAGDCSVCHTGTDAFALVVPTTPKPHMAYKAGTACAVCHTAADWATMPALTPIHANTVTGATCASCHAKAVAGTFASSAAFVADGSNHLPFTGDCAACHVGTGSSIAALPVVNAAKFSGSAMAHAATTSACAVCHGSTITGTTFQGVTKIIVLPPTAPMGASSHIPTTATCESCHATTSLATQVPGVATKTAPGTAFATPVPSTTQIHANVGTSGCATCHEANYQWMGMSSTQTYYGISPKTITTGLNYTGFQTRPNTTGGVNAVADSAHATGDLLTKDCSACHSEALGFQYFSAAAIPTGHIKYTAGTACTLCHITGSDFSLQGLATSTVVHGYLNTTSCLACHSPSAPKIAGCATQAACASPPPVTYLPTVLPTAAVNGKDHIPVGSAECGTTCHNTTAWKGIATAMGGSGANATVSLNMHNLVYVTQKILCKTCHESTLAANWYNFTIKVGGKPNHHGRTSTTQDCAGSNCHSTTKFNTSLGNQANAGLIRPVLRSAIVGARPRLTPDGLAQPGVDAAGNEVFDHRGVLPGDCASCHNGQMAKGLPVKHLVSRASCDSCHRTTAWKPAEFSHQGVPMGQCQVCHNGQNGPGKVGGHFVTSRSCDACHKVVSWLPVMYSHTSPQYVAQPDKTSCLSCHVTNGEIIPRQMRGGPRPRPQ